MTLITISRHMLLAAALTAALAFAPATRAEEQFHYNETNVAPAVYFAALSNLANTVMFSGLGEPLVISPYERDEWLRRAGFVTRPAMPDMAAVGPLFAGGEPSFQAEPDFTAPRTLSWDQSGFDRTLDPAAQAWAMIKITSPEFHLQYHDLPDNRLAGLMMIPQARAQAQTLKARLTNAEGLFAGLAPDGASGAAVPRNQIAALWAIANMVLAGTSERDDYWHAAYRDLTDSDSYHPLLSRAFAAVTAMPPETPADHGLAIEALGRFALATGDEDERAKALALAREHADNLEAEPGTAIEDIALAIYGLTEAGRIFSEPPFTETAQRLFKNRLLPLWDDEAGLFRSGEGPVAYGPRSAGAVVAALNAVRWHGQSTEADLAGALFPRFFEEVIIRSGLMQASPLPLVAAPYLERTSPEHFAHPALPEATSTAPVFASEAVFEKGAWRVSNPAFHTADALFLANMLAIQSEDGQSDIFLPTELLSGLRR